MRAWEQPTYGFTEKSDTGGFDDVITLLISGSLITIFASPKSELARWSIPHFSGFWKMLYSRLLLTSDNVALLCTKRCMRNLKIEAKKSSCQIRANRQERVFVEMAGKARIFDRVDFIEQKVLPVIDG